MPRQYYTDLAEDYDTIRFGGTKGALVEYADATILKDFLSIVRANIPLRTLTLIDVPVGTGRALKYMEDELIHIVGCDITPAMLKIARKISHHHCLGLIQADASELPFPNESFDCISALRFFHLFPLTSRKLFSQEFGRILKPGGFIICSFTNGWYGFGLNWVRQLRRKSGVYLLFSSGEIKTLFPGWKMHALRGNYLPLEWAVSNLGLQAKALSSWLTGHFPLNRFCHERFYLLQKPSRRLA
jgi:ubiquinone/menaquinone biosynthesis C-methylase UbiE